MASDLQEGKEFHPCSYGCNCIGFAMIYVQKPAGDNNEEFYAVIISNEPRVYRQAIEIHSV